MGKDDRRCSRQGDPVEVEEPRGSMLHMTAELIPAFSGRDKTYSVTRWIQDVEDNAEIFSWTPLQQLLVARRALTGTAALWLRAERPHKTWEDLKAALSKEFSETVDVKAIHEIMSARKKQPDESCLDYMLTMKELGKRGKMPDYVAIKYVIDGIVDKESNKMMLYGVTTYIELKEKLKIYETIKEKMDTETNRSSMKNQNGDRKCFNCGENRHLSAVCPHKSKGVKCFNCNSFGHVASQCGRVQAGNSRNNCGQSSESESADCKRQTSTYCCDSGTERNHSKVVEGSTDECQDGGDCDQCECGLDDVANVNINIVNIQRKVEKPIKPVEIYGKSIDALIDSGSDVNLISSECYRWLGSPVCEKSDIVMTGLGATKVRAMGVLTVTVYIDGQEYKDIRFHIVSHEVIPYSIIVGQQLLQQTVMVIHNNKVCLVPADKDWLRKLMCVVSNLDVKGREVSPAMQQRVKQLITSHVPIETKEAPIQLHTHLDFIPVSQRSGCLAYKDDTETYPMIEQEAVATFMTDRDKLRVEQKKEIMQIQAENFRVINKRTKSSHSYGVGDAVAERKTQYGICTKLKPKYLGRGSKRLRSLRRGEAGQRPGGPAPALLPTP